MCFSGLICWILGLFLLQSVLLFQAMGHSTYIPGTDGYFLLVQAQSLLSSGMLKVPDGGLLAYPIFKLMKFGLGGEVATKLVLCTNIAAFETSLIGLAMFYRWKVNLGLVAIFIFGSVALFYHGIEFPKLTMAIGFFPWWFIFLRIMKIGKWLSLATVLVACTCHSALIGPSIVFIFYFILKMELLPKQWRQRTWIICMIVLVGAFIFVWLLSLQVPWISWNQLPGIIRIVWNPHLDLWLRMEIGFCLALFLVLGVYVLKARRSDELLLIFGLIALAFLPSDGGELFDRAQRMSFMSAILVFPTAIWIFTQEKLIFPTKTNLAMNSVLLVLISAMSSFFWLPRVVTDRLPQFPYAEFEKIVAFTQPMPIDMLIAARPLKFFYTARTGRNAFPFEPEKHWPSQKIWRVVFDIEAEEYFHLSDLECSLGTRRSFAIPETNALLIREDCWRHFRSSINEEELPGLYARSWENERNPSQMRPESLRARYRRAIDGGLFSAY